MAKALEEQTQRSKFATPSRPAHAHIVSRTRLRPHALATSPPRVSRTRAPVPRACTSAWVTRVAQARGPAHRRLLPYPRIRSALCSRLRTSRNTRVSAAATAMAQSCPHARPSPQLPEPRQSGSTCGKRLPGGGSAVAGRDPTVGVCRLQRRLPGGERTAKAPDSGAHLPLE